MGEYLSLQVLLHAEFQRPTPIAKELETFDKAIAEFFESADKFNPDA